MSIVLYRAMCDKEANETLKYKSLSWNSKFKWFGTNKFVTSRVMDGEFNNSKFVENRYNRLLKFEFSDNSFPHFSKCGFNEFMLNIRKIPMVKIISVEECENIELC